MKNPRLTILAGFGTVAVLCSCVSMMQDEEHVLVRNPAIRAYEAPAATEAPARAQWEYAAMSLNAYKQVAELSNAGEQVHGPTLPDKADTPKYDRAQFDAACAPGSKSLMPLNGWTRWTRFPDGDLRKRMQSKGMYFEVFERTAAPREIVVVFEGTTPGARNDWPSNLYWFRRFIPGDDQYTVAAKELTVDFVKQLRSRGDRYAYDAGDAQLRTRNGEPIKLVATGHSLGGGLAQHFAYNFLQELPQPAGPKVTEVFAFNPTPVTGWFSSPEPARSYNATGLRIHRVWERGEVLGFLRYVTSRLAVSAENPLIWEYRYNFDPKANIVRNHSMQNLACGLANSARPWI